MIKKMALFTVLIALLFVSCGDDLTKDYTVKHIDIVPMSNSISIMQGKTYQLEAKALPESAINRKLSYSSSDEKTASVTDTGLITAHRVGGPLTVTIKAVNGVKQTVNVTVTPIPVTNMEFITPPPQSLVIGDQYRLELKIEPENATNKKLLYSADNNNVSVSENGTITALKDGGAVITVKSESNPAVEKKITVNIVVASVPVTNIEFITPPPQSLIIGEQYTLELKIEPENATNKKLLYSAESDRVSVDESGMVTALKEGSTTITVKSESNPAVEKQITVNIVAASVPVTNIEFITPPPQSLIIGEQYTLELKIEPENATNKKLLYIAENDNVSVSENGTITALKDGNAVITAKSESTPTVEKKITVTIKKKPEIKIEENKAIQTESSAGSVPFKIKTLYGKLDYTPVIQDGAPWLTEVTKDSTNATEDTLTLHYKENKTVWYREAYIKLKDKKTNTYLKGSDGKKDMEIKLIQERNNNPNVTIRWVQGIGSPAESEKSQVEIPHSPSKYYDAPYIFYWNETENTKFFNTRKVSVIQGAQTGGHPDLHQCWAKTSSNMLHWWFEQNKELIAQYKTKKNLSEEQKKQYDSTYTRGLLDNEEHKKSYIANIFRTKCGDSPSGSYIQNGLRWYLFGLDYKFAKDGSSPALFKDVFTNDTSPITTESAYSKERFETIIKDALGSGKAIGIDIMGKNQYAHAVTLWGAAFDEEDNIIAVYLVDNNFKENRIFPLGIYYPKNIYKNHDENFPHLIYYAGAGKSDNLHIHFIVTLDKGIKQFEEWLSKHP